MGGLAERVAADERVVARKPAKATFEQAAAVPLAGLTALQALREQAKLGYQSVRTAPLLRAISRSRLRMTSAGKGNASRRRIPCEPIERALVRIAVADRADGRRQFGRVRFRVN